MAWDANRPVPYKRLAKEWLIYATIMVILFATLFRDSTDIGGVLIGLVVSFPLWIGFSYVLAKFGYQRKTLAELRTARASVTPKAAAQTAPSRPKPAPTRRTSTGPNRARKRR
jgi:hypothetical protein